MCLDKDILVKGNKIYSPETCVFVPERINTLFIKKDNDRGVIPVGVRRVGNKYRARCNYIAIDNKNKRKELGTFDTPEDAFYKGYKLFKEDYIKEMAERYKDKIPENIYKALYRYEVEITD